MLRNIGNNPGSMKSVFQHVHTVVQFCILPPFHMDWRSSMDDLYHDDRAVARTVTRESLSIAYRRASLTIGVLAHRPLSAFKT